MLNLAGPARVWPGPGIRRCRSEALRPVVSCACPFPPFPTAKSIASPDSFQRLPLLSEVEKSWRNRLGERLACLIVTKETIDKAGRDSNPGCPWAQLPGRSLASSP